MVTAVLENHTGKCYDQCVGGALIERVRRKTVPASIEKALRAAEAEGCF